MQAVIDKLTVFYLAMGNPPETSAALVIMAEALTARSNPEAINAALNRCMVECRFPVRLPDIFSRIPGLDAEANAEKRLAWEIVEKFARDWVEPDMEGNYQALESREIYSMVDSGLTDHYGNAAVAVNRHVVQAPELSNRILDTVRRTGDWSVYKRLTDESFPHQQKRFFEEYQAWTEIQHVAADPAKVLMMPSRKLLQGEIRTRTEFEGPARTLSGVVDSTAAQLNPDTQPEAQLKPRSFPARHPVYEPPTPEEIADRKQTAKASLEWLLLRKIAERKELPEAERLQKELEKILAAPDPTMIEGRRKLEEEIRRMEEREGERA